MMLTDKDLKDKFKYGMSAVEVESEDTTPLRGLVQPNPDNPEVFELWINAYSETYFSREVEPDGDGYLVDRNGVKYRLFPIPENQKVII